MGPPYVRIAEPPPLQASFNYAPAGLPGQFSVAGNWSNKPKIDLAAPFTITLPTQQLAQGLSAITASTLEGGHRRTPRAFR
jgi:hypothetical protein